MILAEDGQHFPQFLTGKLNNRNALKSSCRKMGSISPCHEQKIQRSKLCKKFSQKNGQHFVPEN